MRRVLFALCFARIMFISTLYAQCDQCAPIDGYKSDYCYSNENFPDYCVQFSAERDNMVLSLGKKTRFIPIVERDSLEYYINLASNKSYKLKALEILLLQQAIEVWNTKKRDIGMEYTVSGLGYKMISDGDGSKPMDGQTVKVHYKGTLEDGTVFDNSYDRGQPISFVLGQGRVIKGWDEGIKLLNQGGKALLRIPSELGYGARGAGGVIPPNATLYFEVELVGIQ